MCQQDISFFPSFFKVKIENIDKEEKKNEVTTYVVHKVFNKNNVR